MVRGKREKDFTKAREQGKWLRGKIAGKRVIGVGRDEIANKKDRLKTGIWTETKYIIAQMHWKKKERGQECSTGKGALCVEKNRG